MKKIFAVFLILASLAALAKNEELLDSTAKVIDNFDYQKTHITGDWEVEDVIFKIELQSDESIKVYVCDGLKYLADNQCEYKITHSGKYNREFGAYCLASDNTFCSTTFQVSLDDSKKLLSVLDPLYFYRFSDSDRFGVYNKL